MLGVVSRGLKVVCGVIVEGGLCGFSLWECCVKGS